MSKRQLLAESIFDWENAFSTKISKFPKKVIWYSRVGASSALNYPKQLEVRNGDLHGAALSHDFSLSQEKAKSELIERWAYVECLNQNNMNAGLEIDNSSTGFAALPISFSTREVRGNALAESLERWVLNNIYYQQNIKLTKKDKCMGTVSLSMLH